MSEFNAKLFSNAHTRDLSMRFFLEVRIDIVTSAIESKMSFGELKLPGIWFKDHTDGANICAIFIIWNDPFSGLCVIVLYDRQFWKRKENQMHKVMNTESLHPNDGCMTYWKLLILYLVVDANLYIILSNHYSIQGTIPTKDHVSTKNE